MEHTIFDTDHLSKTYFKLSLPLVLGMVVTLVYNLADTFFIAQTGDTTLVAAVSLCAPVFTTLMAFGNIYGQGGSSLISRLLGQQDINGTKRVSSFCFYIALVTGAVIGALMLIFRAPLLGLLGAQGDTLSHAIQYYTIMALGAPAVVLSFIHSNLVRCEGLAAQSMMGSAFGTVLNIILDPILISGMGMGALGAAIATVIGYLASDIFFLFILAKYSHCLSVSPALCRVSGGEVSQIFGVGTTAALTNLMQSAAVIILNQFLLPYGSEKIAAMGIVLKVNMIAQLILVAFAFGGVPLFGYLYGAGDHQKLRELLGFCIRFLGGLSLAFTALLFVFASPLVRVFLDVDTIVLDATAMLRWQAVSILFVSIVLLLSVLFQASGLILPAFLMSISRQGVIFILVLFLLVNLFGYTGIIAAQAAADLVSAVMGLILYKKYMLNKS